MRLAGGGAGFVVFLCVANDVIVADFGGCVWDFVDVSAD